MAIRLFDTHVHLDHERFQDDLDAVVLRAREAGVGRVIQVSYDLESSARSCDLARRHRMRDDSPHMWCAVGIHPHHADSVDDAAIATLRALLDNRAENHIVAVGEIGLDYHYDHSPREKQQEAFRIQLELAREYGLPVILHEREAHEDCLRVLRDFGVGNGEAAGLGGDTGRPGVFHCFSGSPETARIVLDMGFYLGFDGPLTFKNARKTPDVVRMAPPDRILIETDCPYLAPEPYRGKRNEPAYVLEVLRRMSDLLDCPLDEMAEQTWMNACELFRIEPGNPH